MTRGDPRLWAIAHPYGVLVLCLASLALVLWGNLRLQRGGLFDGEVILRADDPWRVMDRYVHETKHREGFDSEETITFFLNGGLHAPQDLARTIDVTQAVKSTFGDAVLSLSEIPAYEDTGEVLRDDPYLTPALVTEPAFDLSAWQAKVQEDPSVYGLFVDRHFAWTAVVRYLPPGHDEITEFRRTAEFLEGRTISPWEWYWKTDIMPRHPQLAVGGWVMGRGMLDQGLNVDVLQLVVFGVLLTFPVFWLTLGSFRHALLSVLVLIAGGFLWTRGVMGLLGMRERVFSVLAYANAIVQGTSFALHKCEAWAESESGDAATRWRQSQTVDPLIVKTAGIALFGFLTLYTFEVKPIRELGMASAIGVVGLSVLALCALPGLALLGGGRSVTPPTGAWQHRSGAWFGSLVQPVVEGCIRGAVWLSTGFRPVALLAAVIGLFGCVAVLFARGAIESRTRALDFIRGTSVERQARLLNQEGNLGFEFLDLLVEPRQASAGLSDPHFLAQAWAYQAALRTLPDARESASILSTVHRIAQASFHKPFPTSAEEIAAAFTLLESRLAPAVQRQLYFPQGVRVAVSYGFDDSVRLGRFCRAALDLAQREFPELRVSAFNKVPLYPRVDHYVRWGKVWNVLWSQVGLTVIYWGLLWQQNRGRLGVLLSPVRGGLAMALPLFVATAAIGLIMWRLHIPLDMATASIGALAINAAGDFSLYLAMTYQDALQHCAPVEALQVALRSEGAIIVADCLLNTLCFFPLLFSHFLPVHHIGWIMGVMLVACAIGTLLVMAAILPHCARPLRGEV
jgi:predicted RND superfamily exporter protein